jgi:hypothetical protein
MFKVIGRILTILLVAVIVAGGLYFLVQNGSSNSTAFAPDRQFQVRTINRTLGGTFAPPDGFREHDSEGNFSFGRGMFEMVGTLLKIGVVALVVIAVQNGLSALSARRTVRT